MTIDAGSQDDLGETVDELPVLAGPRQRISSPHRRRLLLGAVYAIAAWFYYWTATSSADPITFGERNPGDPYNLLADGFLHGKLSILALPPKGLLALKDPYDPYANAPYSGPFHDLALYHGHFYLTWGPTPVLTLFIPWRVLHLGDLGQNLACLILGGIGLLFSLLLLDVLVERYAPHAPHWKVTVAAMVLASANLVPFLLRTPEIYQVSIAGAYCFGMISLYLLASALRGPSPGKVRLALGSLCAGLAAGSHWDFVLMGGLLVALAVWQYRRDERRSRRALGELSVIILGPFALVVALLLAYNVARFGSPLQFGASYQLAGYDPTTTPFYKLGYLWPSLYYYVISPVRWTFAFPFFALAPPPFYPGSVPATYVPEEIGGVLTTTPLLLLLIVPLVRRRRFSRELIGVSIALLALAGVLAVLIAFSLPGGSMRYEADYTTLLCIPVLLVWLTFTPTRRAWRRLLAWGGAVLALYGVVLQVALSVTGPADTFRLFNPSGYSALQHDTSVLPTLIVMLEGHASVVRVIDPDAGYPTALGDYGTYRAGASFTLLKDHEEIDVIAPSSGRYVMTASYGKAATAPAGGRITVFVQDATLVEHFRFRAGVRQVALPLVRGLNQIEAWVTFTQPQAPGAWPDILTVQNLSFPKAPAPR